MPPRSLAAAPSRLYLGSAHWNRATWGAVLCASATVALPLCCSRCGAAPTVLAVFTPGVVPHPDPARMALHGALCGSHARMFRDTLIATPPPAGIVLRFLHDTTFREMVEADSIKDRKAAHKTAEPSHTEASDQAS